MNRYYEQQAVTLFGRFSVEGVATDPSEVTLWVRRPDRSVGVYTLSEGGVERVSVGVFRRDVVVDQAGVWNYRYAGEGVRAVDEGAFEVMESRTLPG